MGSRFDFCKCKDSPYFFSALVLTILGSLSLTIALSSPFWLVSNPESDSNFVRLGLWNVCFKNYQHPSLQFDQAFDGCYSLHGHKSQSIKNWLQPGWFVFVQCLMTCAMLLSLLCFCLLIYLMWPLTTEIKIFISVFIFVLEALTVLLVFLGVCIFGVKCFDRSWIQYPKYNYLSWGYGFSILSTIIHSCTAGCLLVQAFQLRKLLYRSNIVYHLQVANK